jgi:hypothetical protein
MSATPIFPGANVRSQTYYVARSSLRCLHCRLSTASLALALPQGHETLHAGDESVADVWQRANVNALLFYVEGLPGAVQRRLQQLSRFFRPAYDPGAMNSYWANHCEHCCSLMGDHELHCEPDGAFMPSSEAAAKSIQLQQFQEPFAAAAVGYACEPEFFTSMSKG